MCVCVEWIKQRNFIHLIRFIVEQKYNKGLGKKTIEEI